MTTTLVEGSALPVAHRETVLGLRRIAGYVLLLCGLALLCVAAIALRFVLAPHVVVEPAFALQGFTVCALLGVLAIAVAIHARGEG